MRRTAPRVAGGVVLAIFVVALVARGSAQAPGPQTLNLVASNEGRMVFDADPRAVRGYWGDFKDTTGTKSGNYRATCVWLGGISEDQVSCSIVLSFGGAQGGVLIMQGPVNRPPTDGLFAGASDRQLAVTGGTGPYKAKQGYADVKGSRRIDIILE